MSNLSKLEFVALDISEKNYLSWILNAEIHLAAKGLSDTINPDNAAWSQDKAKAMIFLRHHLDEGLKVEYLTVKDPLELWTYLKRRYDHLKATIVFQLKLCGETINDEDMIEKMLTTFHASNVLLKQQYCEKGFQKYYELISYLLVAEQHNALLMKKHKALLIGAALLQEANGVQAYDQPERWQDWDHNNMRGRSNGRG
ncbi:uncharacterized protein LOC107865156 [Capsicum annuum]|uniref:uncharacterized protein LOC107865156 n=1 Tax=Capsicum annuum TaxID=4072 RepID=UPI0007BED995|nr:uncharacterized protein LOC107865156 [Capsicum annuum]